VPVAAQIQLHYYEQQEMWRSVVGIGLFENNTGWAKKVSLFLISAITLSTASQFP